MERQENENMYHDDTKAGVCPTSGKVQWNYSCTSPLLSEGRIIN